MSKIADNLKEIQNRIAAAASRSGRSLEEIQLVAVTKTRTVEEVLSAIEAGVKIVAENRVQEALSKHARIGEQAKWHLIGHLQKNKVKKALSIFEMIHSVDTLELAREISRQAAQMEKSIDILLQVSVSGELSKFGLPPEQAYDVAKQINELPAINLCGLMTMPPFSDDPESSRPYFRVLAKLKEELTKQGVEGLKCLSMGMSNDFEVAIEEGANLLRIGSAIFKN